MGLFRRLFGGKGKGVPDPLTLSQWLQNMLEAFYKMGEEILKEKKNNSAEMLSIFTLIASIRASLNVLHRYPESYRIIGPLFCEFRLYYECFWQNFLLSKHPEALHEKISYLYAEVQLKTELVLKDIFDANTNIAQSLNCASGADFNEKVYNAVRVYIHRCDGVSTEDDPVNMLPLVFRIVDILSKIRCDADPTSIMETIGKEIADSVKLKFLTDFDLENCEVLIASDEFYKSPPSG